MKWIQGVSWRVCELGVEKGMQSLGIWYDTCEELEAKGISKLVGKMDNIDNVHQLLSSQRAPQKVLLKEGNSE